MSIPGQTLRGFVGQSMSGGRKAQSPATFIYPALFTGGASQTAFTWTAPESGWFRFVMWGGGGGGVASVGSGAALVIAERVLAKGQTVALAVGPGGNGDGNDTTATFPNGEVLTAGKGIGGTSQAGGVAVGRASVGDILVNGNASTASPGAGASYGEYRGGQPTSGTDKLGMCPGGGGNTSAGGGGLVVIHQVRLTP